MNLRTYKFMWEIGVWVLEVSRVNLQNSLLSCEFKCEFSGEISRVNLAVKFALINMPPRKFSSNLKLNFSEFTKIQQIYA